MFWNLAVIKRSVGLSECSVEGLGSKLGSESSTDSDYEVSMNRDPIFRRQGVRWLGSWSKATAATQ